MIWAALGARQRGNWFIRTQATRLFSFDGSNGLACVCADILPARDILKMLETSLLGLSSTRVEETSSKQRCSAQAGVPRSQDHWLAEARAAFGAVRGVDAALAKRRAFPGCFGPNLVGTYAVWRDLYARGFFDMMAVSTKLDEQRSERVIGLFLAVVLGDEGSIGGDYLLVQRPPKSRAARAKLPFRKTMAHAARSRDQWHRR